MLRRSINTIRLFWWKLLIIFIYLFVPFLMPYSSIVNELIDITHIGHTGLQQSVLSNLPFACHCCHVKHWYSIFTLVDDHRMPCRLGKFEPWAGLKRLEGSSEPLAYSVFALPMLHLSLHLLWSLNFVFNHFVSWVFIGLEKCSEIFFCCVKHVQPEYLDIWLPA